jgi:hypothetical protein
LVYSLASITNSPAGRAAAAGGRWAVRSLISPGTDHDDVGVHRALVRGEPESAGVSRPNRLHLDAFADLTRVASGVGLLPSAHAERRRDPGDDASQYGGDVNWFEQLKDVLGIALATLAIALSLLTVFLQRQQHQRDSYRQMYDTLMSEDLHRGRWLINEISATTEMPDNAEDVLLIFRTLGTFDTLAMYVRHGVIPRRWVMDVWHHPLREMRSGAEIARAHRIHPGSLAPVVRWPQLWQLIDEAETYVSHLACCDPRGSQTKSSQ